jgi:nicotinamidase-related amidase
MAPLSDSRTVSVPAKPGPITLDISSTAALVVDMQNDFASKGGMFDRAGIDISITRAAIGPTAKVLACMREAGIRVVYLKQGHKADRYIFSLPSLHRLMLRTISSTEKASSGFSTYRSCAS